MSAGLYWFGRLILELVAIVVTARLIALALGFQGRDASLFTLFTAAPTVAVFWAARWAKWLGLIALLVGSLGFALLAMLAGSFYAPGASSILVMVIVLALAWFVGRQSAARKYS